MVGTIDSHLPTLRPSVGAAEALYEKIMSRGQFSALQTMRTNSPTGGALGSVSDYEGKTLRASVAALDKGQGEGSFRQAIDSYIADLESSKANIAGAYEETYSYRANQTPVAPRAQGTLTAPPRKNPPASGGWGKAKVVGN
jgi:hypothetical protein